MFTRSGEVMVRVQEVGSGERFTQDQLAALQYFHKFSFTHVLRLEKYPIKFDPTNAKTAFYIVPLNKCKFGLLSWSGKTDRGKESYFDRPLISWVLGYVYLGCFDSSFFTVLLLLVVQFNIPLIYILPM